MTDGALPRILLVTKGLDLGGIERVVVDLAVGLSARGVQVEVAVVSSRRDRLVSTLASAGITVHRLGGNDMIGVGAAWRLIHLTRAGGYDVVHVHGPLPAVVARLAGVRAAVQVITTAHTPWMSLRRPTRLGWRATAAGDAATVAVSSAVAESLPRPVGHEVVVIAHGVDPVRIRTARMKADRRAALAVTSKVALVAVASHRDVKNYPNLLRGVAQALAAGASLSLVAIGDGPGRAAHVELARSLGIESSVTFMPSVDEALTEIAAADLLVVASDHEGQPIVVAEALALGVPVIATAVGRVPEMVNASVGRVVPPRDPEALGVALLELAKDPVLRSQMSAQALRLVVRTLDDVIDAHLSLYTEVLGR